MGLYLDHTLDGWHGDNMISAEASHILVVSKGEATTIRNHIVNAKKQLKEFEKRAVDTPPVRQQEEEEISENLGEDKWLLVLK